MSAPTCATCRFLGSPAPLGIFVETLQGDDDMRESEHRYCARIIHGNAASYGPEAEQALRDLAVVTDGSGYAARLRVLPEFGCALHEAAS